MNIRLAKYFGCFCHIDLSQEDEYNKIESVQQDSDLEPLLKEIFSVDPETGKPRGDIQYFMSKSANPTVKSFVEQIFFAPRQIQEGYSPDKVSDDLIVELSRGSDELIDDYAARLSLVRDKALADYQALQNKSVTDVGR